MNEKISHLANNNFVKHSPLYAHYSAVLYKKVTKFDI